MNWNKIKFCPHIPPREGIKYLNREDVIVFFYWQFPSLQKLRKLLEILCVPVGLLLLSDLTTSPKLITSLLINTKISIDLIREMWERSGTMLQSFPALCPAWPEPQVGEGQCVRPWPWGQCVVMSSCQSHTSACQHPNITPNWADHEIWSWKMKM